MECGADAVKVGIGPGSICTTRIVTGVGVPQVTAIRVRQGPREGADVPLIADGGIRFSGDVIKAIAAGAHSIMIGSPRRDGGDPGRDDPLSGKDLQGLPRDGLVGRHETGARTATSRRGESLAKLVPEGIEGMVPFKGSVTG